MDSSYLASGRDRHHNGHIVDCLDRIAAVLCIAAIVHQVQNPPLGLLEERNAHRRLGPDLDRRRLLGGPVRRGGEESLNPRVEKLTLHGTPSARQIDNPAFSKLVHDDGRQFGRLRLAVAQVSWEPRAGLSVDIAGKYPMLRIRGDAQKSGRDQLYPAAPEFGEMLLATPEAERRGRVFKLLGAVNPNGGPKDVGPVSDPDYISHVVCRIGEAAGVKVDSKVKRDRKTGEEREAVKYASAHDLRRSFGFRWSRRIMPAELRELMRHADIATTMRFYVGQDAESTADVLWAAYRKAAGNSFGNSGRDVAKSPSRETTQALDSQGLMQVHPTGLEPVTFGSVV